VDVVVPLDLPGGKPTVKKLRCFNTEITLSRSTVLREGILWEEKQRQ
jgi:hypothetical protein